MGAHSAAAWIARPGTSPKMKEPGGNHQVLSAYRGQWASHLIFPDSSRLTLHIWNRSRFSWQAVPSAVERNSCLAEQAPPTEPWPVGNLPASHCRPAVRSPYFAAHWGGTARSMPPVPLAGAGTVKIRDVGREERRSWPTPFSRRGRPRRGEREPLLSTRARSPVRRVSSPAAPGRISASSLRGLAHQVGPQEPSTNEAALHLDIVREVEHPPEADARRCPVG